jgi:cyclopropane fatty-acyl-phospholipid synthase-like methyltransferase
MKDMKKLMAFSKKLPWRNEREFYDLHSADLFHHYDFYDASIIGDTDQDCLSFMLGELRLDQTSTLIDLGCGSGYLASAASQICRKAIGISTSKECIRVCKERRGENEKLKFLVANMENYVHKGATHVVAMESMGYASLKKTFRSVNKSLGYGGIFYIKEVARLVFETQERRENRQYVENYYKYKHRLTADIIKSAQVHGFDIMALQDRTDSQNNAFFLDSSKYNKSPLCLPHTSAYDQLYVKQVHIKFRKVRDI